MRTAKIVLEEDGRLMWTVEIRSREDDYISGNAIMEDIQTMLDFLNRNDKK